METTLTQYIRLTPVVVTMCFVHTGVWYRIQNTGASRWRTSIGVTVRVCHRSFPPYGTFATSPLIICVARMVFARYGLATLRLRMLSRCYVTWHSRTVHRPPSGSTLARTGRARVANLVAGNWFACSSVCGPRGIVTRSPARECVLATAVVAFITTNIRFTSVVVTM